MTGTAHMNAVEIEQAIDHRPGQPAFKELETRPTLARCPLARCRTWTPPLAGKLFPTRDRLYPLRRSTQVLIQGAYWCRFSARSGRAAALV